MPTRPMPIKFVLLVNKQGQTRLSKYINTPTHARDVRDDASPSNVPSSSGRDTSTTTSRRQSLLDEAEIVRRCLRRTDRDCNSIDFHTTRVVYRRYASLFFIVGVDKDENTLAVLEWIHCLVEAFDKFFGNVCELDLMFRLDVAYSIIDEMLGCGWVVDANKQSVLSGLKLLERSEHVES